MSALPHDDRTARARIRDAAVELIAAEGTGGLTARKVAEAADVSPGLVMHHFGSMDGLRAACDEYVVAVIRVAKEEAMAAGPSGFDLIGALRDPRYGPLTRYLAAILHEDSAAVADLVDEIVADAAGYLQQGIESGMLRPVTDVSGVAAVLAIWQLGALVMHQHVARMFGADLTSLGADLDSALARYLTPVYEVLGRGVFTKEAAAALTAALASLDPTIPVQTSEGSQ
jgi:AcrR family transcriptional regulator